MKLLDFNVLSRYLLNNFEGLKDKKMKNFLLKKIYFNRKWPEINVFTLRLLKD